MKKKHLILVVLVALFLADFSFGQGCSQCKLLAEQGSELDESSFGTNINYGILYIMIIPYILLFLFFHKRIIAFLKSKFKKSA